MAAALLLTTHAWAQIPEPGFETWSAAGPFLAPNGWGVSPGVTRSPDAYAGSWALQCKVDTFTNPFTSTLDTVAGTAYTGAMLTTPPAPGSLFGGFGFTGLPDSLTGYYKFQGAPGDSMLITAYASYWDTTTHSRQVLTQAMFTTGVTTATYQRFSVPFATFAFTHLPDTAFVQVSAANPQLPYHMGTSAWVDALNISLIPDAVNNVQAAGFRIYPNPFANKITIEGSNVTKATLFNILGQQVAESHTGTIDATNLPAGRYIVRLHATDGSVTTQQLIKQ